MGLCGRLTQHPRLTPSLHPGPSSIKGAPADVGQGTPVPLFPTDMPAPLDAAIPGLDNV
jgi:hypothetical protein